MGTPLSVQPATPATPPVVPPIGQTRRWWPLEIWDEDRPFIILIFSDLFIFLALLGTLVPVFLAMKGMSWAGFPEAHLDALEEMHRWAVFVGCAAAILNFDAKLIAQLFVSQRREEDDA